MGRFRETFILAGCCVAIGAVGVLDWWTGIELRVYPFYFLPIAVGVQIGSRFVRYGLAVLATLVWKVAYDLVGGATGSWVDIGNLAAQFAAFTLVAFLVGRHWDGRKREEQRSREDYLTGLQNSRAFFETLGREVERANRYHHPLALAYLDLDDFKIVNDTRGHSAGDEVLRSVARILKASLRSSDVVARLGGDEFAILLVETDREAAEVVLRKVHAELDEGLTAQARGVTVSIGAAICEAFVPSAAEFVRRADALMYEIKRSGKNGCRVRTVP